MAKSRQGVDWLNRLLIASGAAFVITACAYVVMMVRLSHGGSESGLIAFLAKYGFSLLMCEMLVLAAAVGGVIVIDEVRSPGESTPGGKPPDEPSAGESDASTQ